MKGLMKIVLVASALGLAGCASTNKSLFHKHLESERTTNYLIDELSKSYKMNQGYLDHTEGNRLLKEFWIKRTLNNGEQIKLEPFYGPYNQPVNERIRILLKKPSEPNTLREIDYILQGRVIQYLESQKRSFMD